MRKGKQLGIIALIVILIGSVLGGTGFAEKVSADDRAAFNGLPLGMAVTLAGGPDRAALGELDEAYRLPGGIVQLKDGSIVVADTANHVIRRIADGQSSIYAGASLSNTRADSGLPAGAWLDGQSKLAFFNQPAGLAVNAAGDVFVADAGNHAIRKIDAAGKVTTIAGSGVQGFKDGKGEAASFNHPQDVVAASDGMLYAADTLNHVIRRISPQGEVTTIGAASMRVVELRSGVAAPAGNYRNGTLAEAQFNEPAGLALDAQGNLYVSDSGNQAIRYIDFAKGSVTTAAGAKPSASTYQAGALYADHGFADGAAAQARFHSPRGLAWSKEQGLVIADALNHVVRKLKDGKVTTIVGSQSGEGSFADGTESESRFHTPSDVAIAQGKKLLIADTYNAAIREWTGYTPPAEWKKGQAITIAYGDKLLASDVAPQVKQGRVMLPVRAIGELFGYKLTQGKKEIQLTKGSQKITLSPGDRNVVIEAAGSEKRNLTADIAPYILNGRVIAPLRLVAEIIGKDVQWAGSDKLVIIRELKHSSTSGSVASSGTQASSKSARYMEITSLRGDSKVSFGGMLTVDAYIGMKLGEGAELTTGANAAAQLRTQDKGDEISVGSNTILVATELRGASGILTTRLNVVAGHIFSHVADLTHSADRFEVQTGQLTNAVRGTQIFTSVDPLTGQVKLVVASGKVSATTSNTVQPSSTGGSGGSQSYVYPSQQITLGENSEEPLDQTVDIIDLEDLINEASPDIIMGIIKNKAEIDKENEAFLEELKKKFAGGSTSGDPKTPDLKTLEDLGKFGKNMDQLIGNIAKEALDKNKISKEELQKMIEEANKKIDGVGKKLDLDKVEPLDKKAGLEATMEEKRQQALKRFEEEKKAKLDQQKKLLEQMQAQFGSMLNQMGELKKKQEEANKKAAEEARKRAEEALLKQLSAAEKEIFLKAQKQAELEKKRQQAGSLVKNGSNPAPTVAPPAATPELTASPAPTASPEPTASPAPTASPEPTASPTPTTSPEPTASPTPKVEIFYSDDAATEIKAGIDSNYFQSLYFGTENIDLDTEVQVKVTLEKDGQALTGLPVHFNGSIVESNAEGSFILRKAHDENYTLDELQDPQNEWISYDSNLKESGIYKEKTELLQVAEQGTVVLGGYTRMLVVTPNAVFSFNINEVDFYQEVEGLWKFKSNVYGLADDAEIGYRITLLGPDDHPVAGQVIRILVSPHDFGEEPQEGEGIVIETNNQGSTLLRVSQTGSGTVGELDLAGRGIDISLTSTLALVGDYHLTVQLVQLDDNIDIGEPMLWYFRVNPTS
ncbi:stalk domain-containing protein [Paenibacillus sp. PL91]|uniref:stalk domain-containing protein n=1 Tax=Paenibacillus sp. PL91 TaxID=2729538 RepID=UPI00145F5E44|nr:stalk domain-containing protein [Paenibacillus sp. PL91]MBC9202960.1 FecR domain-containing protein [Paenibacillus sp. PL91]